MVQSRSGAAQKVVLYRMSLALLSWIWTTFGLDHQLPRKCGCLRLCFLHTFPTFFGLWQPRTSGGHLPRRDFEDFQPNHVVVQHAFIADFGTTTNVNVIIIKHCSKSSFFVQKFNFDFPRKLSIYLDFGVKNS